MQKAIGCLKIEFRGAGSEVSMSSIELRAKAFWT